jgi:hypothetical protein
MRKGHKIKGSRKTRLYLIVATSILTQHITETSPKHQLDSHAIPAS